MKKLLVLNLYYAPESFGGATIVAEQNAQRLAAKHQWSVLVVTTMRDPSLPDLFLRRYRIDGVDVVAINLPEWLDGDQSYASSAMAQVISHIAEVFQPDVCHCHAIQQIGCEYFDQLRTMGCKIVVTAHDCWWLCDRQFMINSDGLYCGQWKIDESQCRYCAVSYPDLVQRNRYLRDRLAKADLILFPSRFHRDLHLANGVEPTKCRVNKNGVKLANPGHFALRDSLRQQRQHTTFGFVGGPGTIKGADQILEAFRTMTRTDYVFKVVDAAGNLGSSWKDRQYWKVSGTLKFVPPYQQDTMDEFFAGIDVLLFPSRWKESFGLTVREALARDVWVIATDAGGVAEDLVDGINADVLPFGCSSMELRQRIETCLDRGRWAGYVNIRRADVRGFDEQAAELSDYLSSVVQ